MVKGPKGLQVGPEYGDDGLLLETTVSAQPGGGKGGGRGDGGKLNNAPTDIVLSSLEVADDLQSGALVATLDVVDPDRKDRHSFALLDDAGGLFEINSNNQLVIANGALLAALETDSVSVTISVTDMAGAVYFETVTFTIQRGNTGLDPVAPEDILLSANEIAENSADGTEVGQLSVIDQDGKGGETYRLLDSAQGRFALDGNKIVVAQGTAIDFESAREHVLRVEVTDEAGLSHDKQFVISVRDVVEDDGTGPVLPPDYVIGALVPDADRGAPFRWNADQPLGTAVEVSFAFLTGTPYHYASNSETRDAFRAFSAEQKSAALKALSDVAAFTGITFVEVAEDQAEITFGTANLGNVAAYSYLPMAGSRASGDIWLNNQIGWTEDMTPGGEGYMTLIHELGHALGLEHPHEATVPLPAEETNRKFTVMSYSEHPYSGGIENSGYMAYDIAALQFLYGKGTGGSGDDIHSVGDAESLVTTIWDSGGHDVLDASTALAPVVLDLMPGAYSSVGTHHGWYPARDNIAIAFGSEIEDAVGGAGNDQLRGNHLANRLDGGAGNDTLTGGEGADVFVLRDGMGRDVVTDFDPLVDLVAFADAGMERGAWTAEDTEAGLLLSDGENALLLEGVVAAGFSLDSIA